MEAPMRKRTQIAMTLTLVAGLSVIAFMGSADAQRPRQVPAGDCQSMIAASGGKGIWFGQYTGRAQDESSDRTYLFAGSGCFKSEYDCRRWTHEMMSAAGGWPGAHSCRPYN